MDTKNIRTLVQLGHFTDEQTKDKKAVTDLSSHIFLSVHITFKFPKEAVAHIFI